MLRTITPCFHAAKAASKSRFILTKAAKNLPILIFGRRRKALTRRLGGAGQSGRVFACFGEQQGPNERISVGLRRLSCLPGRGGDGRPASAKTPERCVETWDAGRYSSRRRVSTGGAADPLPIVRLPGRDTPRNTSRELRDLLFRKTIVIIGFTAIWLPSLKKVRVPFGVRVRYSSNSRARAGC